MIKISFDRWYGKDEKEYGEHPWLCSSQSQRDPGDEGCFVPTGISSWGCCGSDPQIHIQQRDELWVRIVRILPCGKERSNRNFHEQRSSWMGVQEIRVLPFTLHHGNQGQKWVWQRSHQGTLFPSIYNEGQMAINRVIKKNWLQWIKIRYKLNNK